MYGQFPTIRRNLYNVIAVLDLSTPSSLAFIANPITTIISRNLPFRWGIVPNVETETGTASPIRHADLLLNIVTQRQAGKWLGSFTSQ